MSIANWFNNRILVNTANWASSVAIVFDPPAIDAVSLPNIYQGTEYVFTFTTTGTDPVELILTGSLPPGMLVSGKNLSGTPTVPGTFLFGLTPKNENGSGTTVYFTITVLPVSVVTPAPLIIGATLQAGNSGGGSPGPIKIKLTKKVKRWPTK